MIRKIKVCVNKWIFPRPLFEKIAGSRLLGESLRLLMLAYRIAKYGHKGQKRDDLSRYFDHPKCVALIFMLELGIFELYILIASLLHDIREDSFILTIWDIEKLFGRRVRQAVEILTKEKGIDYYKRLTKALWWIKMIKMVDHLHNMRTLKASTRKKKIKQLKETYEFYFPFAQQLIKEVPRKYKKQATYLFEEMKLACQRVEKTLK